MPGQVLVRKIQPPATAKGGLILPDSSKNQALMRGEIVQVGESVEGYNSSKIKVGKKAAFVVYSAADLEEDDLWVLPNTEIKFVYE